MLPQENEREILLSMLTTCRPAGTRSEKNFIRKYISPLGMEIDGAGNLSKRIGTAPVLWSCHTDTVHRQGGFQHIAVNPTGIVTLAKDSFSTCLGADDTAGVWLMREMIKAKTPGLYVFHRGEERGGIGSSYIAKHRPQALAGIQCAIALDRCGYDSTITHQLSRCCSNAFAESLSSQLRLGYKSDDSGIFTDTANYTGLIGECTNLSVGYHNHHTRNESLDTVFLFDLRDALIDVDVSKLTHERTPGAIDQDDFSYNYGHGHGMPSWERETFRQDSLTQIVKDYPHEIADLLEDHGYDTTSLLQYLVETGQPVRKYGH